MRLSFIFFYLSLMVSSAKKYKDSEESLEKEPDETVPFVDTVLDLRGGVRSRFALEAASLDFSRSMVCSPLSVLVPLGKLLLGADEKTSAELLQALGLQSNKQLSVMFEQILINMEYLPGVTLDLATRLFVASIQDINSHYMKHSTRIFKSSCQRISVDQPIKSAKLINKWVAENTRGKIRKIIDTADIDKDTSMVIVNAIYFSGNWKDRFSHVYTDDFFTPSGKRRIPMMQRHGDYNYWKCDVLNAQLIEIPYEGEASAMIIVLPQTSSGLPVVIRALKLAPELLNQALEKMKTASVILSIPKFKIESELDLKQLYGQIGVKKIFSEKRSGLDGIMKNERVYVTKAVHKAIIEVNEKGTEAAAASGVGAVAVSGMSGVIRFKANRPFLFYIIAHQQQLFAGIYTSV